jgi:hypothetical protein
MARVALQRPKKHDSDNELFNKAVSRVQIWSEHAIGYLKGRFQSLKSLHVRILNKKLHKYATYWIAACIAVHKFALESEARQREAEESDSDDSLFDPFILDGLSDSSLSSSGSKSDRPPPGPGSNNRMKAGQERR